MSAKKRPDKQRDAEPLRWALFAAGGQLGVLIMPALLVVVGLLIPLGVIGEPDATYELAASPLSHPVVSALVFAALGLVLWHCCHRAYHMLHDLQVDPPAVVLWLMYAPAVVAPVAAWLVVFTAGG